MLALQLVIGVGIALLFPPWIYTGVAAVKAPRKASTPTNRQAETSEEIKRANRERIDAENEELRRARVKYAKLLFNVMTPAGLAAVLVGYLIGINSIGIGLLTGAILCLVYGYAGCWSALPHPLHSL